MPSVPKPGLKVLCVRHGLPVRWVGSHLEHIRHSGVSDKNCDSQKYVVVDVREVSRENAFAVLIAQSFSAAAQQASPQLQVVPGD